jgi:carboxylate-amine ligase
MTVGIEEELMLLHPATLDLAPRAAAVLARLDGDARFMPELPAAQLEIVGAPATTVPVAAAALLAARADLARGARELAVPAGAGVHPFAAAVGEISRGERYAQIVAELGSVVDRQLVFGLHVHVAIGGPERALAVYNAVREHLPAIAALGAGSPFYEGRDAGLASVRPKLCDLLPRQGIPPVLHDWEEYAGALSWECEPRPFADARWWWEARPHPVHGTIEVRAADAQATVADTAALAAVVHALVATLATRHDAGELPEPAATWRIAENRWSACRHGSRGTWRDVRSGAARPMADHLHDLLDDLGPAAHRLGCATHLAAARDLVERPRAELARAAGPWAWTASLAERFLRG